MLDAALQVFLVKGYHGTTTKEIADAAGISVGTMFRLFPNKEDILMGLVSELVDTVVPRLFGESMEKVLYDYMGTDMECIIRSFIHGRLVLFHENKDLISVIHAESAFNPRLKEAMFTRIYSPMKDMIEKFIALGVERVHEAQDRQGGQHLGQQLGAARRRAVGCHHGVHLGGAGRDARINEQDRHPHRVAQQLEDLARLLELPDGAAQRAGAAASLKLKSPDRALVHGDRVHLAVLDEGPLIAALLVLDDPPVVELDLRGQPDAQGGLGLAAEQVALARRADGLIVLALEPEPVHIGAVALIVGGEQARAGVCDHNVEC